MKHLLAALACVLSLALVSCAPKQEKVYIRVVNAGQDFVLNNKVTSNKGFAFDGGSIEAGSFKDFTGTIVFTPKDHFTVTWSRPSGGVTEAGVDLATSLPASAGNRFALVITDDNRCVVKLIDPATNQTVN
jgi:hypothetical protein